MNPRRVCLLALLCLGCRSEEPWTFGFSRVFYEDGAVAGFFEDSSGNVDPGAACVAPFLLALPIALDILFLPVALPRDIIVHGSPGG